MELSNDSCIYHWPVPGTSRRCNGLRIPVSRLGRILRWVPLDTPGRDWILNRDRPAILVPTPTHFTCAVALLLIVKFSASEARELSRSPVNTFPGCPPPINDCCCVPPSPPAEGAALWAAPVVDGIPRPPPGMRTSPSASKPCRPNPNVCLYRVCPFELVRWMGSSVF